MTTKTKVEPQIHMEETIIEDAELEHLLDERQEAKEAVAEFRKLDKEAKGKIQALTQPMPVRIGRYIIDRQPTPARSVSFDTTPGTRITINKIGEE